MTWLRDSLPGRETQHAARPLAKGRTGRPQRHGLLEHGVIDHRDGRFVNANLADHLVPVDAVFHATGRRVRDLPITAEALL